MKVKVFQPNSHGKIEFTRAELETLLNEIYEEGRKDCERTHNGPFIYSTPYYGDSLTGTTTTSGYINSTKAADSIDKLTCNSANESASFSTPAFTVSIGEINNIDKEKVAQRVRELVDNFTKVQNDPFTNLAKELNF